MTDVLLRQQLPLPFCVHEPALAYCAHIDPQLQWAARGLSGYDGDENAAQHLTQQLPKIELLKEQFRSGTIDNFTRDFISRAQEIFLDLLNQTDIARKYFFGKHFIFVIGPPRCGGTFVLRNFFEKNNIDFRTLEFLMVHDNVSSYPFFNRSLSSAKNHIEALVEFSQFLAWAERAFGNYNVIIQKRISHAFWLRVLDCIFSEQATYIITLRHPLSSALSFCSFMHEMSIHKRNKDIVGLRKDFSTPEKLRNDNSDEWLYLVCKNDVIGNQYWESLSYLDQYRLHWEAIVIDIARYGGIRGKILPVVYGEPMPSIITPKGDGDRIVAQGKPRNYEEIIKQCNIKVEQFDESIQSAKRYWRNAKWELPDLPLL